MIATLALLPLLFTLTASKELCSSETVPGDDGDWVCNDDWRIKAEKKPESLKGKSTWVIYYFIPSFFAVSKIRALIKCDQGAILRMNAAVWDEGDTEEDIAYRNVFDNTSTFVWINFNIPNSEFTDETTQIFSGFARRSPYWRLEIDMADEVTEFCLPDFNFFVRTGTAASSSFMMNIILPETNDQNDWPQTNPPTSDSCDKVVPVPAAVARKYRLDTSFYRKYTSAYDIPVMSSTVVDDRALQRACYVVRFMLADRKDIRYHMYNNKGRVAIIGRRQTVPMVPEMRIFPTFNRRAAGGTFAIPVNVGAEENMLCERGDGYAPNQDIFMHEFAHGVHLIACHTALPNFNSNLQRAFQSARYKGLWRNTYANTNNQEYFAEGVQAYFNQQREGPVGGDGIQNNIDTREELRKYDPTLYKIIEDLFPCNNDYIPRCNDVGQTRGLTQKIKMNCKGGGVVTPTTPPIVGCSDDNSRCVDWAKRGECNKNPAYMLVNCKKSCNQCKTVTTLAPSTSTIINITSEPTPTVSPTATTASPFSKTTTLTTTEARKSCTDDNYWCKAWASKGECQKNPLYMLVNCRKSCEQCTGGKSCINANANCPYWRSHCSSNAYMKINCKKTCGRC